MLPALLAVWLLLIGQAALAADTCSGLPPTRVSVSLLESPLVFNGDTSFKALKGMSNRYADQGIDVLGLTIGKAQIRASSRSSLRRDPSGQWECATHQITIAYGFQPITLYVGREFPPDSCGFREIHAHEMRHAQIYQEGARRLLDEITASLQARFDNAPPVRVPAGSTSVAVQQELNTRWIPYIQRLLGALESQQRDVDSPEEYARVKASCQGEIQQRAMQAKKQP
ncbi:MAG: hypothetical protein L6Q40_09815 [Azonexus sp.]|nr:hypothetical protein [Azonexus sp.]